MKSKLKAVQILEIQSGDIIYSGEEWLHIDEALTELKEFIKDSSIYRKDLSRLKVIFNGEISKCGSCGELKRRGFGCYCGDEDEK